MHSQGLNKARTRGRGLSFLSPLSVLWTWTSDPAGCWREGAPGSWPVKVSARGTVQGRKDAGWRRRDSAHRTRGRNKGEGQTG